MIFNQTPRYNQAESLMIAATLSILMGIGCTVSMAVRMSKHSSDNYFGQDKTFALLGFTAFGFGILAGGLAYLSCRTNYPDSVPTEFKFRVPLLVKHAHDAETKLPDQSLESDNLSDIEGRLYGNMSF